jgi:hypothetical protein
MRIALDPARLDMPASAGNVKTALLPIESLIVPPLRTNELVFT